MRFLKEKRFIVNVKHCKESQGEAKALIRRTHTIHYGRRFPVQIELKQRGQREVDFFALLIFAQVFGQMVLMRVRTLSNTNLVASRHVRRGKVTLSIGMRR